jgi:hypothetical protein
VSSKPLEAALPREQTASRFAHPPTTMSPYSYEADDAFGSMQRYGSFSDIHSVEAFPLETPSVSGSRTTSRVLRSHTSQGCTGVMQTDTDRLGFLPLAEWDEYNSYEEDTPSHLRYSIEWKIAVNSRAVAKDTEQDVVLAPAVYWRMYLQAEVEKLVEKKLPRSSHVELDDVGVVASVKDRSESDLTKRFDDMNIDWSVIERQFVRWSEPFRAGRKLKVSLTFNYIDSASGDSEPRDEERLVRDPTNARRPGFTDRRRAK